MMELLIRGLESFKIYEDRINILKINSRKEYKRVIFNLENASLDIKVLDEGKLQKYYLLSTLFQYDIAKKVKLKLLKYYEEQVVNLDTDSLLKIQKIYQDIGINMINDRFNINIENNLAIRDFISIYNISLNSDFSSIDSCIETISQGIEILNEYSVVVVYGIFDLLNNYDIMLLCEKITSKKIRILLIDYNNIELDFFIKKGGHIVMVDFDLSQISNI